MSPRTLASIAKQRGIEVLALTDHNSSLNCPAFADACYQEGILPLFGMEATVFEELHVLCLFAQLDAALEFSHFWYTQLPAFPNDPLRLGDQVYVDADENIIGEVENYLGVASNVGLNDLGPLVASYQGLVIPAHIDRPAFSMTSQLGFVADGPWAALECVHLPPPVDTRAYPLIRSSDAHYPEQIAKNSFKLEASLEALTSKGQNLKAFVDMAALVEALSHLTRYPV